MNLDKALDILEVNNPSNIKVDDLKLIAKKAKKRWHPDTIASTNPSEEKIKEYENNFNLVSEAIYVLESFLSGSYHNPNSAFKGHENHSQKSSEEILRENASEMQSSINAIFDKVKSMKFLYTEEDVVLSEGDRIKDLMKFDLEDRVPFYAILSYFYSGYIGIFLLGILLILTFFFGESFFSVVGVIILLYSIFQAIISFTLVLPMSRFWLPLNISLFMEKVTNFNLNFFNSFKYRSGSVWHFIFGIPVVLAKIFYYFVYFIYQPFILIFGNKIVRRVVIKQAYYANYAEWYINDLLKAEATNLKDEELFDLGDIYTNLTKIK